MNNLLSGKTFLIGFAVGVVAGAAAYKYVAVDKKISTKELTDGIMKLAKQVGGASGRSGMGMGRGGGRF
ncbi:hypothetical protein [uncultured Succinatimonas sp.]|uniref:hypothetical protein n=1 Tax=uncultured Succinatimonas sp. TaxID=1262973 RepID=UPI0025D13857|nr:hypothetical protein [uncultured Succinatimonas sp.]